MLKIHEHKSFVTLTTERLDDSAYFSRVFSNNSINHPQSRHCASEAGAKTQLNVADRRLFTNQIKIQSDQIQFSDHTDIRLETRNNERITQLYFCEKNTD